MPRLLRPLLGILTTLSLLPVLTGCAGYHIGSRIPTYMAGVETISVPTFRNETLLPRVEVLAADSVIKQLQQDGTFRVTTSDEADVIVQGTLQQIRRHSLRSVPSDILASSEFNLTLTIDYKVTRRATGEVIDTGSVQGTTSFFVSGNDVNQDERQAIPLALQDAAKHLVTRLTEGW